MNEDETEHAKCLEKIAKLKAKRGEVTWAIPTENHERDLAQPFAELRSIAVKYVDGENDPTALILQNSIDFLVIKLKAAAANAPADAQMTHADISSYASAIARAAFVLGIKHSAELSNSLMGIALKERQSLAGKQSGKARKENSERDSHATELAVTIRNEDPRSNQDTVAAEIVTRWTLKPIRPLGHRHLVKFISGLESCGKLPRSISTKSPSKRCKKGER
jgi:hypothetical protein